MGGPSRPAVPLEPATEPHFYKLGEAARIVGVAPSAVRYWQAEFAAFVRPQRTKTGQHVFSRRDVRALALIRHLLHVDGASAREARERMPDLMAAEDAASEGRGETEQGILDLAAPPRRPTTSPADAAELKELRGRLALAERERDALRVRTEAAEKERDGQRARADNSDKERDAALKWLSDVSRDRDDARRRRDEAEREAAQARARLDNVRKELAEFLGTFDSPEP